MSKEINKDRVIQLQAQFLQEYEEEVKNLEKQIHDRDKEIENLNQRIIRLKNN